MTCKSVFGQLWVAYPHFGMIFSKPTHRAQEVRFQNDSKFFHCLAQTTVYLQRCDTLMSPSNACSHFANTFGNVWKCCQSNVSSVCEDQRLQIVVFRVVTLLNWRFEDWRSSFLKLLLFISLQEKCLSIHVVFKFTKGSNLRQKLPSFEEL